MTMGFAALPPAEPSSLLIVMMLGLLWSCRFCWSLVLAIAYVDALVLVHAGLDSFPAAFARHLNLDPIIIFIIWSGLSGGLGQLIDSLAAGAQMAGIWQVREEGSGGCGHAGGR